MPRETVETEVLAERVWPLSYGFWLRIQQAKYQLDGKFVERYSVCLFLGDKIVLSLWGDTKKIDQEKIRETIDQLGGCRAVIT